MVRNAVDHGLEPPDEREAGRQAARRHRLAPGLAPGQQRGDHRRRRRPRHRLRAHPPARSSPRACSPSTRPRELSDRDLIAYIWHPGLSTAETITEISGRGVGMDIVKSRIENLSGAVDVRSVLGQGTTFTIRLPLTLAIMSSLLVRIYDEIYAIPLDHIDEIVEVRPGQIYRVQGRPAIEIRKKIVALVSLGDVFRWGGRAHPAARATARTRPATGGRRPTTSRTSAPWSSSRTARPRSACWSTS